MVVPPFVEHDGGLEQEFSSLDAQREACAAFVASQSGLGWKALSKRYDDGGISGGIMERPALQELVADIRLGKIDVVVVYLRDVLQKMVEGNPVNRLDDLLPWAWKAANPVNS